MTIYEKLRKATSGNHWAKYDIEVDITTLKDFKKHKIPAPYLIGYRDLGVDHFSMVQAYLHQEASPCLALQRRYVKFAWVEICKDQVEFTEDMETALEWIRRYQKLPEYKRHPISKQLSVFPEELYGKQKEKMDLLATAYYCFHERNQENMKRFVASHITLPWEYTLEELPLTKEELATYCPPLRAVV